MRDDWAMWFCTTADVSSLLPSSTSRNSASMPAEARNAATRAMLAEIRCPSLYIGMITVSISPPLPYVSH